MIGHLQIAEYTDHEMNVTSTLKKYSSYFVVFHMVQNVPEMKVIDDNGRGGDVLLSLTSYKFAQSTDMFRKVIKGSNG